MYNSADIRKYAMPNRSPVPAAQYLRTSTGRQECSLHSQAMAIERYAQLHGFEVVRTYSDAGRSGLSLKNRPALRKLMDDVLVGRAPFKAVLVHDVSRWGRFQDCDEAAHYEFICKQAGVPVHYCAESFANDNSLSTSVMKALKRTMAAEYSREMGERVFAGSKRLAHLGYKQGGTPGFGLRRLLISADGRPKKILTKGEHKNIRTDRVILVPGPKDEVKIVHEIYRLVVEENKSPYRIVRELNLRNLSSPTGHWGPGVVLRILTDPKYAGFNVWNRSSGRLGRKRLSQPKAQWLLEPGAFEALIDPRLFKQTQATLATQREVYSSQDLLDKLRCVLQEKSSLTRTTFNESRELPSEHTFRKHFGTLRRAFELAGMIYQRTEPPQELTLDASRIRELLLRELVQRFPSQVSIFRSDHSAADYVTLDNILYVAVVACPAIRRSRHLNWYVDHTCLGGTQVAMLARLKADNTQIKDFLVLRTPRFHWVRQLSELPNYRRFLDLSEFCTAARTLLSITSKIAAPQEYFERTKE
jgi:DNA invertase Pin-like site-specific DNA recombinase